MKYQNFNNSVIGSRDTTHCNNTMPLLASLRFFVGEAFSKLKAYFVELFGRQVIVQIYIEGSNNVILYMA